MTPLIGILDDCDRPEANMLVLVWGRDANRPNVEYIRASAQQFRRDVKQFPRLFTELSEFGVIAGLTDEGGLLVRKVGESRANYPDGVPRYWQGRDEASIAIRASLAGPLLRAVREMNQKITVMRTAA